VLRSAVISSAFSPEAMGAMLGQGGRLARWPREAGEHLEGDRQCEVTKPKQSGFAPLNQAFRRSPGTATAID